MSICSTSKPPQQDTRITFRLPGDLLYWVQQEGGSGFVREILEQRRALGSATAGPPTPTSSSLQAQWDYLASERRLLDLERELRDDEERVQDRQRDNLEKEHELLDERRELLEEGWRDLEQAQMELEDQKAALLDTLAILSLFPHRPW